jgi:molybdenum cofactor cytidylyltransferase
MTGLIILAAGGSSRLGFPKQTLLYKGKTLLELAIAAGLKSKCKPVSVVLGANFNTVESSIKQFDIGIIRNTDWAEGMASSIRMGISHLQETDGVDSAVIMLCDQPFVTGAVIDNLLYKQQETGKKIIACSYNDIIGVPVLFNRSLFSELLSLQGPDGAKEVLNNHPDDVATIPFEKGSIDIDTFNDYENLIKNL